MHCNKLIQDGEYVEKCRQQIYLFSLNNWKLKIDYSTQYLCATLLLCLKNKKNKKMCGMLDTLWIQLSQLSLCRETIGLIDIECHNWWQYNFKMYTLLDNRVQMQYIVCHFGTQLLLALQPSNNKLWTISPECAVYFYMYKSITFIVILTMYE